MALVIADRVKETTTTTGTGTYTLAGAEDGFQSFAAVGSGNTTYYACSDGTNFEVGIGTYNASGTTLARTAILESSNSDAAVNWGAGTKNIFVTLPASKAVIEDASNNVVIGNNIAVGGTVDGRDIATDGSKLDGIEGGAEVNDPAFKTVSVSGQSNVVADQDADTLTFVAGSNVTITTNASNDSVTISSTDTNTDTNTTNLPIENSSGTAQFTATDSTGLQFAAGGSASVAFDSTNKRVTISATDTNTDTDTTYSLKAQQTGGNNSNPNLLLDASSGTDDTVQLVGSGATTVTRNGDGQITISSTDTNTDTDTNTTNLPIENSSGTTQFTATDSTGLQFAASGAASVSFDSSNKRVTISATDTNTDTNTTDWRVANSGGTQQFAVSAGEQVRFAASGAASVSFDSSTQKITFSSTDTNTDTNTTYSAGSGLNLSGTTFSHLDTSSAGSQNNSNGTVIQDITIDTYGHVTGMGAVDLDGRYYTESEADTRFLRGNTSDTLIGTLGATLDVKARSGDSDSGITIGQLDGFSTYGAIWMTAETGYRLLFQPSGNGGHTFLNCIGSGHIYFRNDNSTLAELPDTGGMLVGGNTVFTDAYHPNADQWTTSRTITLDGAASGSVSMNGSSNVTLTVSNVTASSVNVSESTDNNASYNVLFSDTSGSGNIQMTPQQDDNGLVFNPGTNVLSVSTADASTFRISGTTVINSSRQLQNIASLDSTTANTISSAAGVTIVRSPFSTSTSALTMTHTHGQGSTPDFVYGELEITSAQHGYSVGDCIKFTNIFERDETDYILTFWGNSTTMGYSMNTGTIYREIAHKSTGTDLQLTGQKVRIVGVWYD